MTNYIKNITSPTNTKTIGGEQFDGQWVFGTRTILASSTSITNGESKTIDISSLLPDNKYDYEILTEGSVTTGSTSGNNAKLYIYPSGSGDAYELGIAITRGSGTQLAANCAKIPIKASNQTVRLYNAGDNTGTFGCWIHAYRRIGKNNTENNHISNVAIPSETKVPNTLIFGNPTINNGVISNFSNDNYLDIINARQNNTEYVICFTTASTTVNYIQNILHSEFWVNIEIDADSYNIVAYNWGTASSTTLFTAQANTTYWVKIVLNGQNKTYSYSTDGINYTQVISFSDSVIIAQSLIPVRLGQSTAVSVLSSDRYFRGTINLNECYINVNNERFWDGMDYIKRLPVGGDNFNGQWSSHANQTVVSGISLAVNEEKTYNLSSYIPNDGCQYELLFKVQGRTGKTSGNNCKLRIGYQGNTGNNPRVCAIVTRTSSYMQTAGLGYVILPTNVRTISLTNNSNAAVTGVGVYLRGIRRVGKNTASGSYIENIGTTNNVIPFGGNFADNPWVFKGVTAINAVQYNDATNPTTHNYTINNYLPTNGEWYEILCTSAAMTGSSSGNTINIDVGCTPTASSKTCLGVINTRTNSNVWTANNPIITGRQDTVGNLVIQVKNMSTVNVTTGKCYLKLRAYKKLGTNA